MAGVCVIGNKQTLVVSAYLDINLNIRTDALINILEYRQDKRLGLIVAIDSVTKESVFILYLNCHASR